MINISQLRNLPNLQQWRFSSENCTRHLFIGTANQRSR